jgi:hypothetical protein
MLGIGRYAIVQASSLGASRPRALDERREHLVASTAIVHPACDDELLRHDASSGWPTIDDN